MIFFQNNTTFQTILLVSIISKLFRKLTFRVFETRAHCNKSSIIDLICIKIHMELESVKLEFHKNPEIKT